MTAFILPRQAFGAMLALLASGSAAWATNGYFSNGYGAESKGMSGAGVAVQSDDVMALAQNPAMGVELGNKAGVCASFFSPDRSVNVSPGGPLTTGKVSSANHQFLIPCGGANWQLGDRAALGAHIFANGGMNTEYQTNVFAGLGAGSNPLGVNLERVFLSLNYAYKASETLTFGVAPILAVQRFKATGLEAFGGLSSKPGSVTNNGHAWSSGLGVNLGVLYQPNETWRFGASYRPEIDMGRFREYAGLFADAGDFDIPAMATLGLSLTPPTDRRWSLTAEYERIWYGKVPSIANTSAPPPGPLGASNGVGFGWKNMNIWRLGAVFRKNEKWTLRGGLSYATDFSDGPNAVINILAPATPKWHASLGATYKLSNGWSLSGAYTHAFDQSLTGANPALTGVAQPVRLRMKQDEVTLGMNYSW